jgi:SAM-dependent methyltransferase
MLEIARAEVPGVEFREMDFGELEFPDGSFDAVIAVHALLFATDQAAVLREWLRVAWPGGRLTLSVPGPVDVTPTAVYHAIYDRHGIDTVARYPTLESLTALVAGAGWADAQADADATTAIVLADEHQFRAWRQIGSRGGATADYTPAQHRALTDEMLAVTPRTAEGGYRIPFGALYLTARSPA